MWVFVLMHFFSVASENITVNHTNPKATFFGGYIIVAESIGLTSTIVT